MRVLMIEQTQAQKNSLGSTQVRMRKPFKWEKVTTAFSLFLSFSGAFTVRREIPGQSLAQMTCVGGVYYHYLSVMLNIISYYSDITQAIFTELPPYKARAGGLSTPGVVV